MDKRSKTVHVKHVRPFFFNENDDLLHVAASDRNEFVVEKILEHKGSPELPDSLRFKVLWKGFPVEEASFLPLSELVQNELLHQYCIGLGGKFVKLIPPRFRRAGEALSKAKTKTKRGKLGRP